MKRCHNVVLVALAALFVGCQGPNAETLVLKHPKELKTHLGKRCSIEGVPTTKKKGFLSLIANDGSEYYVAFANMGSWPPETVGKLVRVTGTAAEYRPRLNARGEPVSEQGRLVASYASPIPHLRDSVLEILE